MTKTLYQISNVYHKYERTTKKYIKYIRYKLNEQQYFEIETEMKTYAWRIVKP